MALGCHCGRRRVVPVPPGQGKERRGLTMAGEPAEVLMGVGLLGAGFLITYAAYRDVPVFGSDGLLTGALRSGQLQPVSAKTAKSEQTQQVQQPNAPWWDITAKGSGINRGWRWW